MRSCISSALNRADRPLDSSMSQKRTLSSLRSGPGSAQRLGLVRFWVSIDNRTAPRLCLDLGFCRLFVAKLSDGREHDLPMTERDAEFLQIGAVQVREGAKVDVILGKDLQYLPRPRPFSQSSIDGMRGSLSATSRRSIGFASLIIMGRTRAVEGIRSPSACLVLAERGVCRRCEPHEFRSRGALQIPVAKRPESPNSNVRGRDPECPVYVDSSRPRRARSGRSSAALRADSIDQSNL